MSILLYLPGLLVILFKRRGLFLTLIHLVTLSATQALFAAPFLREDPWAYARSAFDLGRVFLYKWTVNWRLLDEEIFLSNRLATTLLVGHGTVLIAFGLFKWCAPDGGVASVLYRGLRRPWHPTGLVPVTADCKYLNPPSPSSFPFISILNRRRIHGSFHLKPNRNNICPLPPLSILLMVCPTNTLPRLEDSLSVAFEVSIHHFVLFII